MIKRIFQYFSFCIALVGLLTMAGCGSSSNASSQPKDLKGNGLPILGTQCKM